VANSSRGGRDCERTQSPCGLPERRGVVSSAVAVIVGQWAIGQYVQRPPIARSLIVCREVLWFAPLGLMGLSPLAFTSCSVCALCVQRHSLRTSENITSGAFFKFGSTHSLIQCSQLDGRLDHKFGILSLTSPPSSFVHLSLMTWQRVLCQSLWQSICTQHCDVVKTAEPRRISSRGRLHREAESEAGRSQRLHQWESYG
jgi:hypothetical protein